MRKFIFYSILSFALISLLVLLNGCKKDNKKSSEIKINIYQYDCIDSSLVDDYFWTVNSISILSDELITDLRVNNIKYFGESKSKIIFARHAFNSFDTIYIEAKTNSYHLYRKLIVLNKKSYLDYYTTIDNKTTLKISDSSNILKTIINDSSGISIIKAHDICYFDKKLTANIYDINGNFSTDKLTIDFTNSYKVTHIKIGNKTYHIK